MTSFMEFMICVFNLKRQKKSCCYSPLELLTDEVILFQDTAGSERYEAMSRIYYRGAKAAIVCYDLSDRTSFERVRFWVKELKNNEEVRAIL